MIRPEVTEELVNKVKLLSGSVTGSFQDSLELLVSNYEKLIRGKTQPGKEITK